MLGNEYYRTFAKKAMKTHISYLLIFVLGIALGRVSWQYQLHYQLNPVRVSTAELSSVPTISILGIDGGELRAESSEGNIRLLLGEQVAVPNEDGGLVLSLEDLGFLGQRKKIIVQEIPDGSRFIASKSGKYVYDLTEKQAKKLSAANHRYFQNIEEALAEGYEYRER